MGQLRISRSWPIMFDSCIPIGPGGYQIVAALRLSEPTFIALAIQLSYVALALIVPTPLTVLTVLGEDVPFVVEVG